MNNIYDEISKYSKSLMLKEPFYGLFLISLNKELDKNIPTACVTLENINTKLKINPDFWSTLDSKTKLGILKHELLHICFFHLTNWSKFTNKKIYNIAADLEINQYISSDMKGESWNGVEINGPIFKDLNLEPKKGTEYYYNILIKEIEDNPEGEFADMVEGEGDNESKEKGDKGEGNGDGNGNEEGDGEEGKEKGEGNGNGGGFIMDLDGDGGIGEAERKLIEKQIDHQLKEVAENLEKMNKGRGLVPSEMVDYINKLFEIVEPVIDWKSYLRRFNSMSTMVYTKKTRRKPNKRFGEGPALKIKQKKKTLVAIDTSGSINKKDLEEFFNEIYHIYKSGTYIDIVECDAEIKRIYEYKGKRDNIEVVGRGGTDFEPVLKYLYENKNEYANLVYLTDGFCPPPKTKAVKPILWIHSSDSEINKELPGMKVKIKR